MEVDNKMQNICICYVQDEFSSKLFHSLSLNFEEVSYNVVAEGYKDSTAMDIPVLSDGFIVGWEKRVCSIVFI